MHAFQKLIADTDMTCRSYSGRGMFGQSCLGVEANDVKELMQTCIVTLRERCSDLTPDEWDDIEDALGRMQSDSLGRGMIIYFPGIPFTDA